jgi:rSAM/selenodomain-associated transferase 1
LIWNNGRCLKMRVPTDQLIVFVKAPRAGAVKTRLAATIGPEKACALYEQMVAHVLQNLRHLGAVELRYTPADARGSIDRWLQPGWAAHPQGDGDLGERLRLAFADAFLMGAERVAIIGSDCPTVTEAHVRETFERLKTSDLVVGPATDGGYWLIALRREVPSLFEAVPWSTDAVLGETLCRAAGLGLKSELLEVLSDIDTEADWNRWAASRK